LHDVIDNFFGVIEERNINLKEITDEELEKIVAEIVSEKLKLDRNYIFTTTSKYKVLSNRLQKVVTMSVKYIVQSLKQSEFEVFGHEVEFGGKGQYKPITVTTDDGRRVEIIGKIDRVDIMKNPDGTYVRIIDYKSSVKNIDLNQVFYGLQLQLLTYLNETCKVEDFIPAGVLYFNLINPTIGTDKNLNDEEVEEKIRQEFKMKGLILADVNIIKKMDTNIENEPKGISKIIPSFIPAGVLYFNLINPTIGTDKNLTDEEVEEKIRQEFKMKGLILADVNIIKKMDTNIENEPKL
jgi:ATP-dependent helicase/nuclease subunit B